MFRFMTAWDQKDIQGVLDVMNVAQHTGIYLSDRADNMVAWVEANTGSGRHLSDLADGAKADPPGQQGPAPSAETVTSCPLRTKLES